jgi:hypothetical protein
MDDVEKQLLNQQQLISSFVEKVGMGILRLQLIIREEGRGHILACTFSLGTCIQNAAASLYAAKYPWCVMLMKLFNMHLLLCVHR